MEPFPVMPFSANIILFPKKLWELVNDNTISAINWNSQGNAIIVHKDQLESQVLTLDVFKATTFLSFVRQLHYYGFRKCQRWSRERPNIHQYSHPNFMKNHPELLSFIKRYPRHWDRVKSAHHLFPKAVNTASTHLNHMGVDPNPQPMQDLFPANPNMRHNRSFLTSGFWNPQCNPVAPYVPDPCGSDPIGYLGKTSLGPAPQPMGPVSGSDREILKEQSPSSTEAPEAEKETDASVTDAAQLLLFLSRQQPRIDVLD